VIEAPRLTLLVLLPGEIEALIDGDPARASHLAVVTFPLGWPKDAEAQQGLGWHLKHLRADPAQRAWRIRVMVERDTGVVVGSVNMKGPPDVRGDVEIGWGVNEDRRRRGYAFEATTAVMRWAASQPGVRQFSATIPDANVSSQQLARKLGMACSGKFRRELPLWVRPAA
jgi:[ribosomal protein S5]-alanine N-acetyltransferase